jgi:non-specific serine/threonine protein kinase/serine/threonine-protein kinase
LTPAEWSVVKNILNEALDWPPAERSAYLDRACAGNMELRRRVEALVEADGRTWSLLEAPAAASSSLTSATRPPAAGDLIGAYEILKEIGHGGMGIVYLARRADQQFERYVAIKVAQSGLAGDPLERRFRSERQIVANLDHPNIARLLDGGTTPDGRAYLVMEYVEGQPLTQWCDAHALGVRERLEIFLEVCAAVQYAHQHLVVHRDLKPANILVTEQRTVKLLDFGIAKLIDPDLADGAERTGTLFRLLTPDYASPEQIRGGPISTASDVYALGVVLYELLTGEKPLKVTGSAPAEMLWIVSEREPARPSAVAKPGQSKELAGDVDTIVLTALRKEPARRFASANALAEDIRRHLSGLPVEARTDTFGYRAGKFVRRHRAGVAAAALVGLALAGGLVMTMREARRARAAEARAERRFNDVRKLANSNLFELHDAISSLPGSTPAREILLKRALEYLDDLSREKGADPDLQRELASAYQKVADVLGAPGASLGDAKGAEASNRKALEIRQRLAAADPQNRALLLELATSYNAVGELPKALEIREKLAKEAPGDMAAQRALGLSYFSYSVYHADRKEFDKALDYRRKYVAMAQSVLEASPGDPKAARDLALGYKYLGGALEGLHRPAEGLEFYRKAAALDEKRAAEGPPGGPARLDLSFDYGGIGNCLGSMGDITQGLANYRKALALREEVSGADPKNAFARSAVARAHNKIAWLLGKSGDFEGSLQNLHRVLQIRRGLMALDTSNASSAFDVASTLEDIGEAHESLAKAKGRARAREQWVAAKQSYSDSHDAFLELQRQGKLKGIVDGAPERVAVAIARCDDALKMP